MGSPVAEHRTVARHLPGDPGVWFFITADTCMFGLFFASFVVERLHNVALFDRSQQALSPTIGMLNTLFLVSGSYFVVLAVDAAKRNARSRVISCLALALACAVAFSLAKLFEYADKFRHGLTPATNDFFTYYFILTGLHFLHVLIAIVVTIVLMRMSRKTDFGARYLLILESGASYWHMVDLLWVVLFPLVYLVR